MYTQVAPPHQFTARYPELAGKTAVVTGAASGIGSAVARALVTQGCRTIAVDLNADPACYPEGSEAVVANLTDAGERARIRSLSGTADLLVNAAGISRPKDIFSVMESDWDQTMAINAKALFFMMQDYTRTMGAGSAVVNLASIAGKSAHTVHGAVYNASKAAVIALTKTFAYAVAERGIRINSVCPGVTDTPMLQSIYATTSGSDPAEARQLMAKYLQTVPLGRLADPEEIASTIVFLLSDSASYMTGQAVNVSGGLVMW